MRTGRFVTDELSVLEEAIRPWELIVDPRQLTEISYSIEYASLPGVTVLKERHGANLRLEGRSPPDTLVLALLANGGCGTKVFGSRLQENVIYPFFETPVEAFVGNGQHLIEIHLERSLLESSRYGSRFQRLCELSGRDGVKSTGPFIQKLISTVSLILDWEAPGHQLRMAQVPVDTLREDLLARLFEALGFEFSERLHRIGAKENKVLSRAFEYLSEAEAPAFTVSTLCENADISERALQRAVRATFDCTVQDWLRRRRFSAARRELLKADPGQTTVTAIATSFGFYDLGRFARDYQVLYGELPSKTIPKRPGSWASRLLVPEEDLRTVQADWRSS